MPHFDNGKPMHPDLELFYRFKNLTFELRNTAAVVQNNHDQLIEDGQISADDVRRNIAQFNERCEDHFSELQALQRATMHRLDAVLMTLENKSNYEDLSSKEEPMTPKPLIASLEPLKGKHYGTVINIRDERGNDHEIKVWLNDPTNRMSQRQLDDYGYASHQEAKEDGMPCDCHYESELAFLLAQEIVKTINSFQFPSENV
jgi:hypothetical protein